MVLSQDYLVSVSGTHGDSHVRPLEMEIVNLKRQIQANKQSISQHKYQLESGVETLRPGDVSMVNNFLSCILIESLCKTLFSYALFLFMFSFQALKELCDVEAVRKV